MNRVELLEEHELPSYSWSHLLLYQGEDSLVKVIKRIHGVSDDKHLKNLKKQAYQIKNCILLSKNYFDAALSSPLHTRPVLLYYSIMNMSLALILLKKDGNSCLEKLREQHSHHGLTLKFSELNFSKKTLSEKLGSIKADSFIQTGLFKGTFGQWLDICKQPLIHVNQIDQSSSKMSFNSSRLYFESTSLVKEKAEKFNLLEIFENLPGMMSPLSFHSFENKFVRGQINLFLKPEKERELQVVFHPTTPNKFEKVLEQIKCEIKGLNELDYTDLTENAGILRIKSNDLNDFHYSLPNLFCLKKDEHLFCIEEFTLNEYGYYYVGLFILGNLCRYYPEIWIREIDQSTDFLHLCNFFIEESMKRFPLLALSEISQNTYLYK